MIEIKPCPFCGYKNVACYGHIVHCENCDARGPFKKLPEQAIESWNKAHKSIDVGPLGEIEFGTAINFGTKEQRFELVKAVLPASFWFNRTMGFDCIVSEAIHTADAILEKLGEK